MADETRSPGWYPDPDAAAGERWWNGAGWSESRRTRAIIYSAENPAPQRPDPYAQSASTSTVPSRPMTTINVSANRNAMVGFITGLIALFFNVFFVLGPIAIVFSALGFTKARQLKAQGVAGNLMTFAVIGLVAGGIATIIGIVSVVSFIASAFTVNFSG
jgi:Protein of unknown function (DUF2510)